MMTRRRFLQLTVVLAACAPIARLTSPFAVADPVGTPAPTASLFGWVPDQAQVDEWLTYYKIAVQSGHRRFVDIMAKSFADQRVDETLEMYGQAEHAFNAIEDDRFRVAISQGAGYEQGRQGLPRVNPRYSAASNEAFGWYNGWATGYLDYQVARGAVKLPRSPGVTWPAGSRPRHNPYDFGRKA